MVRSGSGRWPWAPADRDSAGAGHLAGGSCTRAPRGAACGQQARMLCSQPDLARDLIVDSCSVRVERGGNLTGPDPTDRAKLRTKYHVAVKGDGLPVTCAATVANINDTVLFERLFRATFAMRSGSGQPLPTRAMMLKPAATCAAAAAPNRASTSAASRTAPAWANGAGRWSAPMPGCWRTASTAALDTGERAPETKASIRDEMGIVPRETELIGVSYSSFRQIIYCEMR